MSTAVESVGNVEIIENAIGQPGKSPAVVAAVVCRTFGAFCALADWLEPIDVNEVPRGEIVNGAETERTLFFRCDESLVALAGDELKVASLRSETGDAEDVELYLGCDPGWHDDMGVGPSALELNELPVKVSRLFKLPDLAETIAAGVGPQADPAAAIEAPVASRLWQTESGMSRRVAATYGDRIRYVAVWKKWIVWDGRRWSVDSGPRVDGLIRTSVSRLYADAGKLRDALGQQCFEAALKFAMKMSTASAKNSIRDLLTSERGLAIPLEQLDASEFLFNVANGIVDVRRGKLLPHDPRLMLTKLAPVEFDVDATCPTWLRFLNEVFEGDRELIRYVQRAVGYSLTGDVREHKLFLLYGCGANGKTTFIETLCALLGDYAGRAAPDLLMVKGDTHPTELADLFGFRLVSCSETEDGRRFAEARVKLLTGGDTLKARRMKEDFWSFRPTHKLWIATNYAPDLRGTDGGIRRRINILPFKASFSDDRQDKSLSRKLRGELPGILQWALEGARGWLADGLGEPQSALLCERLRRVGVAVQETRFNPKNLGTMATATVQAFAERRLALWKDEVLLRDLRRLRIVERGYGVRLEAGRDSDGHADRATALALALAAAHEAIYTGHEPNVRLITQSDLNDAPSLSELMGPEYADLFDDDARPGWRRATNSTCEHGK